MINVRNNINSTFSGGINDFMEIPQHKPQENLDLSTNSQDEYKNSKTKKEKKSNKKHLNGLYIGAATILTGAGMLFLLKGHKGKLLENFQEKINNAKLKETMNDMSNSTANIAYKLYKNTESGIEKATGMLDIVNNCNAFKDVLMKKIMYSSFGLKKAFPSFNAGKYLSDKIADFFVFIGKKSVHKAYRKSKALMLPNLPENSNIKQLANKIYDNEPIRLNKIDDVANMLYEESSKQISKNLGFSEFVADKKMKQLMSEKIVKEDNIQFLRRELSYSNSDKIKDAESLLMNIVNDISIKDNESLSLLRKIKNNLNKIGTEKQKELEEEITKISNTFANKTDDKSKKIFEKINKFETTVKDNYKGAVEKYLEDLKHNSQYTKETIEQTETALYKWIKSLDKAITMESRDYVEKIRDLALGGAFTDILTILGSLTTLTYLLSKADNASERESIALRVGVPALAGIGVSLYCNAKLFAGSKSLISGVISTALLNKLGAFLDDKIKKEEPAEQLA